MNNDILYEILYYLEYEEYVNIILYLHLNDNLKIYSKYNKSKPSCLNSILKPILCAIEYGNLNIIKCICDNPPYISYKGSQNNNKFKLNSLGFRRLIWCAIEFGHLSIIKYFIKIRFTICRIGST